jgi:hypothetical protein
VEEEGDVGGAEEGEYSESGVEEDGTSTSSSEEEDVEVEVEESEDEVEPEPIFKQTGVLSGLEAAESAVSKRI